jgi:hypothetical protein
MAKSALSATISPSCGPHRRGTVCDPVRLAAWPPFEVNPVYLADLAAAKTSAERRAVILWHYPDAASAADAFDALVPLPLGHAGRTFAV